MIPAPGKSARVRRFQIVSVALLVAVGIVNILDRSTLSIANRRISEELQLSPTQMGWLLSAFSLAYAFSQLPIGAVLDRVGARAVLGIGLFVWSAAQLCGGLVRTLPQFIVARIALGIGEAPTFPAGAKLIADWFNRRERGGPTGWFLSSPTIGPAIAPPVLTALMLAYGWRRMFIVMGSIGIGLSLVWYLFARDRKNVALSAADGAYFDDAGQPGAARRKLSFDEWLGLFTQRSTWGIVLGFVGVIYMIWLYLTWLPGYLERERHLTIARVGWVVSIPYLFGSLGSVCCGYLADYLLRRGVSPINSRKWPICIGLVGSGAFTIPMAYTPNTVTAVVYLCVVMFFLYLASGGAWALVNVATPNHMIATIGGLQNFGAYFSASLAPVLTGWMVDRTHSFTGPFTLAAVVAFGAAFVYFTLVVEPIRDRQPNGH